MKNKNTFSNIILWVLMIASVFLYGCGRGSSATIPEKEDRNFKLGQRLYRENRYQESMNAFMRTIESRRDAPESHLEVGRLYLDHFNDPITAIYHMKKFLEVKPNVEQSPMVKQMIETAKKSFVKSLPGYQDQNEVSRVDLMHLLKQVREENLKLRKLLAETNVKVAENNTKLASATPTVRASFVPAPKVQLPTTSQFYTVAAGDTLSKVSHKVYGSSAYWERIYKANGDALKSPHDLKVGQVLKVPPKA